MKVKSMENTLNGKGSAVQKQKTRLDSRLNTDNKNNFIFEFEDLVINIPGGLNDESLESLKVTIKVNKKDSYRNYRQTCNLNDMAQLEKLISRISEQLEIRQDCLRQSFIKLADELEKYRLDNLEDDNEMIQNYSLSDEDLSKTQTFLKSPNLMEQTNNLIGQSGIVGEEINRLLMYLIFTSRKTSNPLHCISFGSSGAGKTHLQSKVAELIPNEDKVEITQLSANAFYYFKQYELKNKLVLIEDMDGAEDGLLPLRELQTKKRISKSVVQKSIGGRGRTYNQVVEGPVCVSSCTTKESMYEDNSNRSFLICVDESPEQDERIMAYQRMRYAGKIDEDLQVQSSKQLRNVQKLLKEVKIVNPYAEHLALPETVFKLRRTNIHYLQLIEVITLYHQLQREKQYNGITGEEYIETTLEDIRWANKLIKDVLLRKSDRLNRVTRSYHESLVKYLSDRKTKVYSNQEIRKEFRTNETTLRRYHKDLINEGYIKKRDDIRGDSFHYEVLDINEFEELETTIEKALQSCIDVVTSSEVRQS
ncbi:hypothetical protein [Psychroserpens luteus]|uniref:Uncharacterized protein n=1 Tax=Psychroserpens luteus TaxID=1434066 RepID=A0ABW5ZYJ0_9FLAO|nr:hypothetical protein [Psychroserpens luteus]